MTDMQDGATPQESQTPYEECSIGLMDILWSETIEDDLYRIWSEQQRASRHAAYAELLAKTRAPDVR